MNLFSFNSWLSRALYLIADIVILHVLWIIFSLPIITIGASTTALYYCGMKRVRRDEGYAASNFITAFKENFKQSTIIWIVMVLIYGILYLDLWIGLSTNGMMGKAIIVGSSILIIPILFTSLYIFPIQAKFDNPIITNLKNAFLMSFSNFGWTLLLVVFTGTFILFTLTFPPFIGLMLICGMGLFGYLTSGIFVYVFRKYIPDELAEDAEATGIDKPDGNSGSLF